MKRLSYFLTALVLGLFFSGSVALGNPAQKITICHNLQHNPVEITVDAHSVTLVAHLSHGDTIGPCPPPGDDDGGDGGDGGDDGGDGGDDR